MKNDFSKQFTPILELGLKEANRFNSACILPEHLVLGAINNKGGYAYRILNQLRVPIEDINRELEEYLSEPHSSVDSTTLFDQQYKISQAGVRHLQLAMSEARKMAAKVIGSEHILLALIHDNRAMDSEIL